MDSVHSAGNQVAALRLLRVVESTYAAPDTIGYHCMRDRLKSGKDSIQRQGRNTARADALQKSWDTENRLWNIFSMRNIIIRMILVNTVPGSLHSSFKIIEVTRIPNQLFYSNKLIDR